MSCFQPQNPAGLCPQTPPPGAPDTAGQGGWDMGRGCGWAGHRQAFVRVSSLTGEVVVTSCPLARVEGGVGAGKPSGDGASQLLEGS